MLDILVLSGNTVRLKTTFKNMDGLPEDPDAVKIIFYSDKQVKTEEIVLGPPNREDTGKYYYDFVAPEGKNKIFFEWNGAISGNPALDRGVIRTTFIK